MLWYWNSFMKNIGDLIEIGKFEISSETLHCCSRKVLGNIELLRKEIKNNNEADFSGSALYPFHNTFPNFHPIKCLNSNQFQSKCNYKITDSTTSQISALKLF